MDITDVTFKGTTFSSLGGVIEHMEWLKTPKKRKEKTYIPMVDGQFESSDDGYDSFVLNCQVVWTDSTKFDEIMALLNGSGVLLYNRDTIKYRIASIEDEIEAEDIALWKKMTIPFFIEKPFRYLLSESDVTKTDFPATYVNTGTLISKPLLKVSGTGTVVFVVNGTTLTYVFDTAYVYIDCDRMSAFYSVLDDKCGNLTLSPDDYPTLSVGSNTISLTSGTITEIVITPRTRFI